MIIFHIAHKADWEAAQKLGEYKIASLSAEGFIHCSLQNQVVRVANFVFKGSKDLVLLKIDEARVDAEVKYEGETEEQFPHIYGPINIAAVKKVIPFPPNADGTFEFPALG